MAWQLIFKAPDDLDEVPPAPALPRKPVSVKVQLDPEVPGVVLTVDDDDEDDD